MPCTTILVGKKASYDGSTIVARNEDGGAGSYSSKKWIVVKPDEQPREYESVISKQKITLPDNPMRYTAMPNAYDDEGLWSAAGVNAANVAMSATETITTNVNVLAADPLTSDENGKPTHGIGEEDIVTLTLPYVHSAREAVKRLGYIHETYGTYEMNGIAVHDVDEIWWFETIGGHHWMARRIPDDHYAVMPNQLGIDFFDFADAYGNQEEYMCASDLKEFTLKNHLTGWIDEDHINPRLAYGSHSDSDHVYNTPRAWWMEKILNPKTATHHPEDDDIPFACIPESKITMQDVKYVLSGHYQGTPYDPYLNHGETIEKGKYRPIGINRNNTLVVTQLRSDVAPEYMAIEWIAYGSNVFNTLVPFYANVDDTPAYLRDTNNTVTTNSFYWANRIIGAMADVEYAQSIVHVERYDMQVQAKAYRMILEADGKQDRMQVNEDIAKMVEEQTNKLLNNVLFVRSNNMKNKYSRSDA